MSACLTCGGRGCEYGCGECWDTPSTAGPDAHRQCRTCKGSGKRTSTGLSSAGRSPAADGNAGGESPSLPASSGAESKADTPVPSPSAAASTGASAPHPQIADDRLPSSQRTGGHPTRREVSE